MKKNSGQRAHQKRPIKPSTVYRGLPPKPFWRLPPELHLEICRHLGFYDLYAMHLTGRYFHGMLPQMPQNWDLDDNELEDAEMSFLARTKKLAACGRCKRLRPQRLKFYSGNFDKGKTARNRLCVACEPAPISIPWCGTDDYDAFYANGDEDWT